MDGSQETSSREARLVHVNLTPTFICSSGFIDCWNKVWNLHFYSFLFFLQKRGDKQRMKPQEEDFFFPQKKENTNQKKRKITSSPPFPLPFPLPFPFLSFLSFFSFFSFFPFFPFFFFPPSSSCNRFWLVTDTQTIEAAKSIASSDVTVDSR